MCVVCVGCVVIQFILGVRLNLSYNMWTHQPGSYRKKATQEGEGGFALIFYREKDAAVRFPRRP